MHGTPLGLHSPGITMPALGTPRSCSSTPATPEEPDNGWASSPTGETYDSEGVPLQYKMMEHLIDHASAHTLKFGGL